jgi:outer membrane receptor protein involved in Fe transport
MYFPKGSMAKIVLRMKLLAIFVLIALVSSAASTYSQETRFNLKLNGVTVREVFREIEQNSKFILLYNETQVDANRIVNVKVDNETVESILNQALEGTSNTFKIYDRQIVILLQEKNESPNVSSSVIEAEQKKEIKGAVKDMNGVPLPGVTVIVKGTTTGTITDADGNFILQVLPAAKTLVFSFVGMKSLEIQIEGKTNFSVSLEEENLGVDEVIVTGVFDKRTRMESSVAISAINTKQIERLAVTSAGDLLKNIPGVFVNSSLGEIRNTVYSRGVSVGSNDGDGGYYYVSMQEDGLPVTNATFSNYGPDYYLRPDATLGKLEAVRGGTASILGNNAPGGIFNYVSKTGGDTFEGEARAKYGLEGDGRNPFYRVDVNLSGPLSKDKSVTFDVGGFLRQADGARNPGYPMNEGGQLKANIVKTYKNGSLKLYGKYLNDKNAWYEFLPTIGFTDPKLPEGVSQTNSVLIPPVQADFTINESGKKVHYDSRDKIHSIDKSVGLNWEQYFGEGWTINNKMRYSAKSSLWNTTAVAYPFATDGLVFYAIAGTLGQFGTYSFNDLASGTQIGSVTQAPNIIDGHFAGFNFIVNKSNFPGAAIQKNSLLFNPLMFAENKMKEFIDQFMITKKLENMSFTAGMFYANSNLDRLTSMGSGISFTQLTSPRPAMTSISIAGFDGKTYQLTNPDGVIGGTGVSAAVDIIEARQKQMALFFGHNWAINPKLNFDWGVRYETVNINGTNQIAETVNSTTGGLDGNPLTLYDNTSGRIRATYSYSDQKVSTFSFSGGLNYKIDDNQAVYTRFSQGSKAPDMAMFVNVNTQYGADNLDPIAQKVQQLEIGYKLKAGKANLFVTPFLSLLSNVPQQVNGQETAELTSMYSLPVLYNKYTTKGVEIEGIYDFTKAFSIRAVATFQTAKATEFKTWMIGANGKADDVIQDFSGNETDNSAKTIIRISPSYTSGKYYASFDFSYMGKRAANVPNAFYLPAFNQTNLNLGYNLTSKWQIQANVNNIFNQNGVMGWSAPGGFPAALNRQGFTKEMLAADPNAVYSTLSLPPRAYFVTLSYKF